jgi:hypothetical protein
MPRGPYALPHQPLAVILKLIAGSAVFDLKKLYCALTQRKHMMGS